VIVAQQPSLLGLVIALLAGLGLGALQGWIIDRWRAPSFIVTLAGLYGIQSLMFVAAGDNRALRLSESSLSGLQTALFEGAFPGVGIVFVIAAFAAYRLMPRIRDRADTKVVEAFALSGGFAALAGVLLVLRIQAAFLDSGNLEFIAIAAVLLGGGWPGSVSILGTIIGTVSIAALRSGLPLLRIDNYWQGLIIVVGILAMIAIGQWRRTGRMGL
jgi:ribose/xylose/arabinose/galactoside ABC-type transport system permease subunit